MKEKNTVVYVARHGWHERQFNQGQELIAGDDASLSPIGRLQSTLMALCILKRDANSPRTVYHSPLPRTMETAEIIGKMIEAELVAVEGLKERYAPYWNGRPRDDLEYYDWDLYSLDVDPPSEKWLSLTRRTIQAFRRVRREVDGSVGVLVTHHDPAAVIGWYAENPRLPLPDIGVLTRSYHLEPGEAWRMSYLNGSLEEMEHLRNGL